MKVTLRIRKRGAVLYEGACEIADAESFGKAFADAWMRLREQKLSQASSIGALYDALDEHLLDALDGADISFAKS